MKKSNFLLAIVILILLTALILRIKDAFRKDDEVVIVETNVIEETKEKIIEFKLEIIEPSEGELISSPLLIKGLISAGNVKEKELYLVLLDNNREIISLEKIEIEDIWLSKNKAPFSNILEFNNLDGLGFISSREKINNQLFNIDNFTDILINFK